MTVSVRLLLATLATTALNAGLPAAASPTRALRATGAIQDFGIASGAFMFPDDDRVHGFSTGRRLQTKEDDDKSFVRRTSGKLTNSANATSTSKSGDKGSKGSNELVAKSEFTLRIPLEEDADDAGDFSAPFVEETVVTLTANKDGVTEDKKDKTVKVVPAPRVPKGDTKPKDDKTADIPRVPEDLDKIKAGKKKPDKKAKVVEANKEVTIIRKPAPKSPPPPAPKPAPKKPPTARTRPRSAPRRGREAGAKPPSSGGGKVKAPKAAPVKEVPVPKAKAKKSRGESRFEMFESTVKGRGTTGKGKFGFAVLH